MVKVEFKKEIVEGGKIKTTNVFGTKKLLNLCRKHINNIMCFKSFY